MNTMDKPENHILVIFGASGDLAYRKLMPSVYNLYKQKLLPEKFQIFGAGRTTLTIEQFKDKIKDGINKFSNYKNDDDKVIDDFLQLLSYMYFDTDKKEDIVKLKNNLTEIYQKLQTENTIYYLSTPPSLYSVIPKLLASVGLNKSTETAWKKLVVEKPFGYDFNSAHALNKNLLNFFKEKQIYRIDHYLGKETVQNIFVTRFSNEIFEPLWNRNYIHRVEITAAESIGVEKRGAYYESSGALRDMVQNHLLQLTGVIAMEPPSSFDPDSIRDEIIKVFHALRPFNGEDDVAKNVIRGQYGEATINGEKIPGYRQEKSVDPNSRVETYVALKFYIDNFRWGGVPFYLRTGKRLPTRVSEVVIHFKPIPHFLFSHKNLKNACNQLIIRIQPDEGMKLKFDMKIPGQGFVTEQTEMDFNYSTLANQYIPEAYERLLYDCMLGDTTLYQRGDRVETAWKFVDPILNAWKNNDKIPLYSYPAGTWGPQNADDLIEGNGLTWRYPCNNISTDGRFCEL